MSVPPSQQPNKLPSDQALLVEVVKLGFTLKEIAETLKAMNKHLGTLAGQRL